MDGDLESTSEVIKNYTEKGKYYLNEAGKSSNPKGTHQLAIEQFTLAHKHALLLNNDKTVQRSCLFNLGAAYVAAECYKQGINVLKTILKFSYKQPAGSIPSKGDILFNIGYAYEKMKEHMEAIRYFEQALGEYRLQPSFEAMFCETLLNLGRIYFCVQNINQAKEYFSEAASRYKRQNNHDHACRALIWKIKIVLSSGSYRKVLRVLEDCQEQAAQIQDRNVQSERLVQIGLIYKQINRFDLALQCFEVVVRVIPSHNKHQRAKTLLYIGESYYQLNKYHKAIPPFRISADLFGALGNRNAQGLCFHMLGLSHSYTGQYQAGREKLLLALHAFKDSADNNGQWQAYECLAAISMQFKQFDKAICHYKQAVKLQGRTENFNSAFQDRLVNKLCNALMSKAKEGELAKTAKPVDSSTAKSTPAKTLNAVPENKTPSTFRPNITVTDGSIAPTRPTTVPRNYRRGRRGYERDSDRPVHQVARGFSTLTSRGIPSPERLQELIDEDSCSSSFDDSDDSEFGRDKMPKARNIIYQGKVYKLYPHSMSHAARNIRGVAVAGKKWKNSAKRRRPKTASADFRSQGRNDQLMLPLFVKNGDISPRDPSSSTMDFVPETKSSSKAPSEERAVETPELPSDKSKVKLAPTHVDGNIESLYSTVATMKSVADSKMSNGSPTEVETSVFARHPAQPDEYSVQTTETDNRAPADTLINTNDIRMYNDQLKEINQHESANEDSLSSVSSDDEVLNNTALMLPASMPMDHPPNPSIHQKLSTTYEEPEISYSDYEEEDEGPIESQTTQQHIYESIRTMKPPESLFDNQHYYDDPAVTSEMPDDASLHSSSSSSSSSSFSSSSKHSHTSTKLSHPSHDSPTDDKSFGDVGFPDDPEHSDTASEKQRASNQSPKSKMCRVM